MTLTLPSTFYSTFYPSSVHLTISFTYHILTDTLIYGQSHRCMHALADIQQHTAHTEHSLWMEWRHFQGDSPPLLLKSVESGC